jgi:methyl-accepting chemotaxis protein
MTMALTWDQIKNGLDDVSRDIQRQRNTRDTGRTQIESANTKLGEMQAKYAALVMDINAMATAEPGNAAAQHAKADKDKLVAEFQALKTEVQAQVDAIAALD